LIPSYEFSDESSNNDNLDDGGDDKGSDGEEGILSRI